MALAEVKKEGGSINTYDEKGTHISEMASSGKEVVGISSDFFVCLEGTRIKTYDEKCQHIASMPSVGREVRNSSRQGFACKEGSWMKTYDKWCKLQNTRTA